MVNIEDCSEVDLSASPITSRGDASALPTTTSNNAPSPSPLLSPQDLHRRVIRVRFDLSTGQPFPHCQPAAVNFFVWLQRVESDFKDVGIPQAQWSDATILLLDSEGEPNKAMRQRRRARRDLGVWEWQDFCNSLEQVLVDIGISAVDFAEKQAHSYPSENRPSLLTQVREEHPKATKVVGVGFAVTGGAVLAPVIIVGGLNAMGFTAAGVAGGSIAAGLQSAIYGGATTGLFSVCQSIAATAAAPFVGSVISAAGALFASATVLGSGSENNQSPGSDADGRDPEPSDSPPPYQPPYRVYTRV